MGTLDAALAYLGAPTDLPLPLPLAHLTAARWFSSIASYGALCPRSCKVFHKELLYLSYGGVHFRPQPHQTEEASELPVGLLFDPTVLSFISEAYPFDSGAVANGAFGPSAGKYLVDFADRFRVPVNGLADSVCTVVHHLYSDNEQYLRGNPDPACETKPKPFPDLYAFLSEDISRFGADHRQRTIECIAKQDFPLDRSLLWVGYPDAIGLSIVDLYRCTKPWIPELFPYTWHKNFNPAAIAERLEGEAGRVVERFVRLPK